MHVLLLLPVAAAVDAAEFAPAGVSSAGARRRSDDSLSLSLSLTHTHTHTHTPAAADPQTWKVMR